MKILTADHVLPISGDPISEGAVAFDYAAVAAVGSADSVMSKYPGADVEDLGKAAILPGFVNAHSHLELTTLRGKLDNVEHDFRSWLIELNADRAAMSEQDIENAALLGALEGARAGVTCFGDIGRFGRAGLNALKQSGLRGIVYQETEFSPDNRTAETDLAALMDKFNSLRADETGLVRVGLSPHSPFTVSSRLFEEIAQASIIEKIPLSIHAAESSEEFGLLSKGHGFFTEVFKKFDVEWESPLCSPIQYLERLGVLSARPLLAHCVAVSGDDIKRIVGNGAAIAHCPRSNAKFGHGFAPFEQFLDEAIHVGLGSDSVASNNVCDILEEARFAALVARNRHNSKRFISAREVLRAATLGGAEAMGLGDQIGSIEPGKQADIVAIGLEHPAQQPINDIESALVFSSTGRDVIRTIVAGSTVFSAGGHG